MFATQVKEKFGGLRFYVAAAPPEARALIREAERKAMATCELCGEPGLLAKLGGWFQSLCDAHAKAWVRRDHELSDDPENPSCSGLYHVRPGIYPHDALEASPVVPLSPEQAVWLTELVPGSIAIRWLGGCCLMEVQVTAVTPETIHCGPFSFSRRTAAELEPALGWNENASGSWIRPLNPE